VVETSVIAGVVFGSLKRFRLIMQRQAAACHVLWSRRETGALAFVASRQLAYYTDATKSVMADNPYLSPNWETATPLNQVAMRHSGLGIASFVIALVAAVTEFALVMAAGIVEVSTPGGVESNAPVALVIGLGICGGGIFNLLAVALAIAALVQSNRKKLFAVLGLVISGGLMLCVAGLFVLGYLAQNTGN
jgi:hypothetical protein